MPAANPDLLVRELYIIWPGESLHCYAPTESVKKKKKHAKLIKKQLCFKPFSPQQEKEQGAEVQHDQVELVCLDQRGKVSIVGVATRFANVVMKKLACHDGEVNAVKRREGMWNEYVAFLCGFQ